MFEKLSYKARRRWALVVLLVGMPIYIVLCVTLVGMLDLQSNLLQLLIYVSIGMAWIIPFKGLFRGIGQPDPDAPPQDDL